MKVQIVHCNRFKGKQEYVGRPSVLGNPYTVKAFGRGNAVKMYEDWLRRQYKNNNKPVIDELKRLATQLKKENYIVLSCWCAPNPCHGEIIGKALVAMINKGIV